MSTTVSKSKRVLPHRPQNNIDPGKIITREHIAEAIRAFRRNGGLIQHLPSQENGRRAYVGNRWESMYEQVIEP